MDPASIAQGSLFLVQLAVGSLGNLSILLSYIYVAATEDILKPVDMIVFHLALVNLISLLTRGFPQVMTLFGVKEILNDAGCKTVIYLYRATRYLSISTTCSLSVFQSATIAPVTSQWGKLKHTILKYMIHSFVLFWTVSFLTNIIIPLYMLAPHNNTIPVNAVNMRFCYVPYFGLYSVASIVAQIFSNGQDVLLVCVMIVASGHILLTLRRHHRQVHYIQRSSQKQPGTAEAQAANTIIKLVTLYTFFYGIDIIILIYTTVARKESTVLSDIRVFFASCYSSLSPLIMVSLNKRSAFKLLCRCKETTLSERVRCSVSHTGINS